MAGDAEYLLRIGAQIDEGNIGAWFDKLQSYVARAESWAASGASGSERVQIVEEIAGNVGDLQAMVARAVAAGASEGFRNIALEGLEQRLGGVLSSLRGGGPSSQTGTARQDARRVEAAYQRGAGGAVLLGASQDDINRQRAAERQAAASRQSSAVLAGTSGKADQTPQELYERQLRGLRRDTHLQQLLAASPQYRATMQPWMQAQAVKEAGWHEGALENPATIQAWSRRAEAQQRAKSAVLLDRFGRRMEPQDEGRLWDSAALTAKTKDTAAVKATSALDLEADQSYISSLNELTASNKRLLVARNAAITAEQMAAETAAALSTEEARLQVQSGVAGGRSPNAQKLRFSNQRTTAHQTLMQRARDIGVPNPEDLEFHQLRSQVPKYEGLAALNPGRQQGMTFEQVVVALNEETKALRALTTVTQETTHAQRGGSSGGGGFARGKAGGGALAEGETVAENFMQQFTAGGGGWRRGGTVHRTLGVSLGGGMAFTAGMALQSGLMTAMRSAEQLQVQMLLLQQTVTAAGQGGRFAGFASDLEGISLRTGVAQSDVTQLGTAFFGLYQNVTQAASATQAAAQILAVTGQTAAQAGPGLVAAAQDLKLPVGGAGQTQLGNAVVAASRASGRTPADTEQAVTGLSAVTSQLGFNLNQTAGLVVAASKGSAQSGGTIADVLSRVLPQLRPDMSQLQRFGITFSSAAQNSGAGGTVQALTELMTQYAQMKPGSDNQQQVLGLLGGTRSVETLAAVAANSGEVMKDLNKDYTNNNDLAQANAAVQASVSQSLKRVQAAATEAGMALLSGPGKAFASLLGDMSGLVSGGASLLAFFDRLDKAAGGIPGHIAEMALAFGVLNRVGVIGAGRNLSEGISQGMRGSRLGESLMRPRSVYGVLGAAETGRHAAGAGLRGFTGLYSGGGVFASPAERKAHKAALEEAAAARGEKVAPPQRLSSRLFGMLTGSTGSTGTPGASAKVDEAAAKANQALAESESKAAATATVLGKEVQKAQVNLQELSVGVGSLSTAAKQGTVAAERDALAQRQLNMSERAGVVGAAGGIKGKLGSPMGLMGMMMVGQVAGGALVNAAGNRGGVGSNLLRVGGYAAEGAGLGAMFGPEGAAVGAIGGAVYGSVKNFLDNQPKPPQLNQQQAAQATAFLQGQATGSAAGISRTIPTVFSLGNATAAQTAAYQKALAHPSDVGDYNKALDAYNQLARSKPGRAAIDRQQAVDQSSTAAQVQFTNVSDISTAFSGGLVNATDALAYMKKIVGEDTDVTVQQAQQKRADIVALQQFQDTIRQTGFTLNQTAAQYMTKGSSPTTMFESAKQFWAKNPETIPQNIVNSMTGLLQQGSGAIDWSIQSGSTKQLQDLMKGKGLPTVSLSSAAAANAAAITMGNAPVVSDPRLAKIDADALREQRLQAAAKTAKPGTTAYKDAEAAAWYGQVAVNQDQGAIDKQGGSVALQMTAQQQLQDLQTQASRQQSANQAAVSAAQANQTGQVAVAQLQLKGDKDVLKTLSDAATAAGANSALANALAPQIAAAQTQVNQDTQSLTQSQVAIIQAQTQYAKSLPTTMGGLAQNPLAQGQADIQAAVDSATKLPSGPTTIAGLQALQAAGGDMSQEQLQILQQWAAGQNEVFAGLATTTNAQVQILQAQNLANPVKQAAIAMTGITQVINEQYGSLNAAVTAAKNGDTNAAAEVAQYYQDVYQSTQEAIASAQAPLQVLASAQQATGDPMGAAATQVQSALTAVQMFQKQHPADAVMSNPQYAQLVTAYNQSLENQINTRVGYITNLNQEMVTNNQESIAQAIANLRALQSQYANNPQVWEQLQTQIQQFINQGNQNAQFNLPSNLHLPTLYEVRRTEATPQGTTYNDNKQVNVQIVIGNASQNQAALNQLMAAVGGPSTSGMNSPIP